MHTAAIGPVLFGQLEGEGMSPTGGGGGVQLVHDRSHMTVDLRNPNISRGNTSGCPQLCRYCLNQQSPPGVR